MRPDRCSARSASARVCFLARCGFFRPVRALSCFLIARLAFFPFAAWNCPKSASVWSDFERASLAAPKDAWSYSGV